EVAMPRLRVHNFAMSLDGFVAGPNQGPEAPLGVRGQCLHEWVFKTRFGRDMIGEPADAADAADDGDAAGGGTGIDNDFLEAAGGADVRLGGGASTVRQYLQAQLVDELHIPIVPGFLGSGERLFQGLDDIGAAYECAEVVASPSVVHVRITKKTNKTAATKT